MEAKESGEGRSLKGRFGLYYWGPVSYYAALIRHDMVTLEQEGSFSKQSYHNRCYIDGPNGELMLNLPIDHLSKDYLKSTRISTKENWRQKHWQALLTSYSSSPFFDALAPELKLLYEAADDSLADLNWKTTQFILKHLRYTGTLKRSLSWELETEEADFRETFHPKRRAPLEMPAYPQVFDHKTGFKKELSILDLMFNEGPLAWDYLQQL